MPAVDLITVPYDSGRRGWRMGAGPQALLRENLMQKLRAGGHDVELIPVETATSADDQVVAAFDLAGRVARVVRASRSAGRFPLILSGSCFSTVGAYAGIAAESPCVLWLDAHGDVNTPDTSASGFIDGMAAATLLGWCHADGVSSIHGAVLPEARLMLVGTRDLDAPEAAALERSGVTSLDPRKVRDEAARSAAIDTLAAGTGAVYLHVDLDVLDPEAVGRANPFAAADGLTLPETLDVMRAAGARSPLVGMTLSAYDPASDADGAVRRAALSIIEAALHEVSRRESAA